jgi:hypothetical protein
MLDSVYNKSFDWDQMFLPGRLTAFDGRKASIAACLARDSYYNDTRYGETLLRLGFYDAQLFCENHLQAIVGCLDIKIPDETLALIPIVFRGSDQVQDWLQNFDVRMTRFINTEQFPHLVRLKVHNGIFENVHDFEKKTERITFKNGLLKDNLHQILRDEIKKKRCFFWIIGHSLGGAMATLFAARLLDYYGVSRDRILTHTFGAPPVGNRYFAARYGHKSFDRTKVIKKRNDLLPVFRFVNTEDPIPAPRFADEAIQKAQGGSLTPPPYQLLGFKHIGQEVRFSPRFLPDFYEKYKTFTGRRYNSSHFMKVHFMEAYITAVDIIRSISAGGNEEFTER